jgi:chromosomal replication initiator protein
MDANQVWRAVLGELQVSLSPANFETWLKDTTLVDIDDNRYRIAAPNGFARDWLDNRYRTLVSQTLARVVGGSVQVEFVVADAPGPVPDQADEEALPPPPASAGGNTVNLNSRYAFSNFIVGSANRLAHAAALSVAERPGHAYNPLFLYGGVGLGKTHLMHAIGHYIQARNRHLNLVYISSDRFINEMINAIRFDRLPAFRQKYRAMDVLLVDDIQFIAGKDRTQEEFFHIFNALHDAQKQIVISSDCPPRQIPTLEERLHSRFEWGLIADIQAPDIETKVAILRKKAEAERVEIPENVALFIASKVRTNIRELEGSLIRLIAYASLTGRDIDLTLAQEILRDLLHTEDKPITIEMIQKFVADQFGVKITELKAKNNSKTVAEPRQIAMYLIKTLTAASLPEIGKAFGGKHHSTVIHSVRKIDTLRKRDPDFDRRINSFVQAFR